MFARIEGLNLRIHFLHKKGCRKLELLLTSGQLDLTLCFMGYVYK